MTTTIHTTPVVDAHCSLGQGRYIQQTPEQLLAQMDRAGVARAVVGPVHEHITVYNREGNDEILAAVRSYPERLIGFATANPWYGEKAVNELSRSLAAGLCGLVLNSALQGYFIHDELVHPLIRVAAGFCVPVYFHTATPIYALPFQLAELARVFPQVDFIMGHMAAADFWTDAVIAARQSDNIYIETSFRSGVATIQGAVAALGAGRILFGSSSPESDPDVEIGKIHLLDLPPEAEQLILGGNILRLLAKRRPAG
jgi:predicted TIM-barrel fold metal-dependent hydrolase